MAISAQTVWEVRPTNGTDTNGGGFVAGSGGTDYSQQNAKNTVGSNISTTDAHSVGTTTITSATAAFTAAITGNIIYFAGGTGSITGVWRQATYVSATSITIDTTIASSTGMTMNIGGALASIGALSGPFVAGNCGMLKGEATFGITTGITFSQTSTTLHSRLRGYTTTRGDNGRVTVQITSGTGIHALTLSGAGWDVSNLIVDCNNTATSQGITASGGACRLYNVTVKNFTLQGINPSGAECCIYNCEITGGTSTATAGFNIGNAVNLCLFGNWIHDNACPGISESATLGVAIINNLISNNSGASSDGIIGSAQYDLTIIGNTIYKSGRNGINITAGPLTNFICLNNIITDSGGWGLVGAGSAGEYATPFVDGNAYYNNASGNREYLDDTGSTNPINGTTGLIYTNVHDVVCTVSPYNIPGSDYSLNSIAGGGQALKGTGVPTSILNYTGTNPEYAGDFGCLPSQPKPAQKLFHRLGRRQSLQ